MARTSRRYPGEQTSVCSPILYKTAIYVRESFIKDMVKNSKADISETIDNQISMLKNYILNHQELILLDIYIDDGQSGLSFQRPAFQKLMSDIMEKKIECIVVKDFSRLGRNLIETGNYLDCIFPSMNVRFISVNDNYDSNITKNNITIPIKNLFNEMYARDVSKNIQKVIKGKQKNGQFIGSIPPYGYLRDSIDYHNLIIDYKAAPVVKQIYLWKSKKMSDYKIAQQLNSLGIMPPYRHFYEQGILKNKNYKNLTIWHKSTIVRITRNPMYLGNMTQGKYKSYLVDGMKHLPVNQSEWIMVENTHEPIIEQELFIKVQKVREERKQKYLYTKGKYSLLSESDYILQDKVYCGECGKKLRRTKIVFAGKANYYFRCPNYDYLKKCSLKSIREDILLNIISISLIRQLELNIDCVYEVHKNHNKNKEIKTIKQTIERIKTLKASLYKSFQNSLLDEEEYCYANNKYKNELHKLQTDYMEIQKEAIYHSGNIKMVYWAQWFLEYRDLSREVVNYLIEKIEITNYNSINIFFTFLTSC